MVFVLSGEVTVYEDGVPSIITAGDAACWKAGTQVSHCMYNHSDAAARYIVIGTRARADGVTYPSHDRKLYFDRNSNTRRYTTLDGAPADAP